jgi:hypothetical protein
MTRIRFDGFFSAAVAAPLAIDVQTNGFDAQEQGERKVAMGLSRRGRRQSDQ